MGKSICRMQECDHPIVARELCSKHYARWRTHGDPSYTERPLWHTPPEVRFFAKVDAGGCCWQWTGALYDGYGVFEKTRAHLWAWKHLVGVIPSGMELDHLCRNRACVNPDHLEPVPQRINWMRGFNPMALNARKTHCPQGHEYAGDNLRVYTRPSGQTSRYCRACTRERHSGARVRAGGFEEGSE